MLVAMAMSKEEVESISIQCPRQNLSIGGQYGSAVPAWNNHIATVPSK
jgi:hypothetical protein